MSAELLRNILIAQLLKTNRFLYDKWSLKTLKQNFRNLKNNWWNREKRKISLRTYFIGNKGERDTEVGHKEGAMHITVVTDSGNTCDRKEVIGLAFNNSM